MADPRADGMPGPTRVTPPTTGTAVATGLPGRWRADQMAVLDYAGGPLAVAAVPGAGKTHVLAGLAARLVAEGRVGDGAVLVVTYMRSAVANFRRRIAQFLEAMELPPDQGYEVRTLHGLAAGILAERPDLSGLPEGAAVMGDQERRLLLERLSRHWREAHRSWFEGQVTTAPGPMRERDLERWTREFPRALERLVEELKQREIAPTVAAALAREAPPHSLLPAAAAVYSAYSQHLTAAGQVDFTDLLLGARRVLERDPAVARRLRQRWPYLFEDEAQDANPIQFRLLQLIASPGGNLVRVGDPNQAIMGTFTAADPRGFREYLTDPAVRRLTLEEAGRSGPLIRGVANHLVHWVTREHPEPAVREALLPLQIRPVSDGTQANPQEERGSVQVRLFAIREEELAAVARYAAAAAARNPDQTVAVLVPTNWQAADLAAHLEKLQAPWRGLDPAQPVRGRDDDPAPAALLAALAYLAAPLGEPPGRRRPRRDDRWADGSRGLARVLREACGLALTPGLEAALAAHPAAAWLGWADAAVPALPAALPAAEAAALTAALAQVRGWLEASLRPPHELIHLLAADLNLRGEELAVAGYLAEQARMIARREPEADLAAVVAELREWALREDRRRFLRGLRESEAAAVVPGVVHVGTYHRAKGLEWDVVYLAGLTADAFPAHPAEAIQGDLDFLAGEPKDPVLRTLGELGNLAARSLGEAAEEVRREYVAERLRLLYVGITRARRQLRLTAHRQARGGPALPLRVILDFLRKGEGDAPES